MGAVGSWTARVYECGVSISDNKVLYYEMWYMRRMGSADGVKD